MISEHWLIAQNEGSPAMWSGCRMGRFMPRAWGDVHWDMVLEGKVVRVHVLCEHYKSHRPEIKAIVDKMKADERMNYWVTYRWVTVDFRE